MLTDPLDRLAALNRPGATSSDAPRLDIGSDVEIAGRMREDMERSFGEIVHAEGQFWRYEKTCWRPIPEHELRLVAHAYDGAEFSTAAGEPARVKLSKSRIDSILNEMAALVATPDYFTETTVGINCASGFIRFDADGVPHIEPHHRNHRCRHTLRGNWSAGSVAEPPKRSLLARLVDGVFAGDLDADDKVRLIAEVAGSAALGYATKLRQPRAVILKGETAENGKSQILDLVRGMLPGSAIASVTAGRMGDERHIVGLVGKLLNASDELSPSSAIASDTFKAIVTGEPVQGRDVYKSRVEFRPQAQHLFATNTLPVFQGGMDRGVQRRLLVVSFNRVIPPEERIEAIGQRIGQEEPDLLLGWAVDGASRLIRQKGFTTPSTSKIVMNDWLFGADPVLAWVAERVHSRQIIDQEPRIATRIAYEHFREWALAEGFSDRTLPSINAFVQRITANAAGIEYRRFRDGRFFVGMVLTAAWGANPYDRDASVTHE
ncbi:DNA primase family protein [Aquamicrobium soli]|uniref:Phage/plasmid primase, P4 family n=1 Tax=Aquamicrobium soli TaxID=1811518 RepID=A0ABV7K6F6_9HYPH